jgi:hypothetical protein
MWISCAAGSLNFLALRLDRDFYLFLVYPL